MAITQAINFGLTVPTTSVWDVSQLEGIDVTGPEFKELLVRLYQNLNLMATALNLKDSAFYDTSEFVTAQSYFPNPALNSSTATVATYRPTYRKVINFGALPNTTAKSVAHNIAINTGFTFTRIYATASDTTDLEYIPIPYASASGTNNVELDIDATDVTITTASDMRKYNVCYVVVEFMKY